MRVFITLIYLAACIATSGKLKVVTTTTMITDLVEDVGGDKVEVTGLMGPGVDPHLYKATAGDVRNLQRCDIVFNNGLYLEGRIGDVLVKMARKGKKVYAETEAINRICQDAGVKIGGELYSDAMGIPGETETKQGDTYDLGSYEGMVKHNVYRIVEALR